MRQTKKILVAPLNWGLGHATRCVPIIRELQDQGAEVLLASDGRALSLLKKEFPDLAALTLPGYGIQYPSKNTLVNAGSILPKLLKAVYLEHNHLKKHIRQYGVHAIISDNRLGCYNDNIPSVYITHQINLIMPSKLLEIISRQLNYHFIAKYQTCWVPDLQGEPNLSGSLSHGTPVKNTLFLGALSRMRYEEMKKKYDAIAVISGPEPQRSNLEKKIIDQVMHLRGRFLIVQGKPEAREHYQIGDNIEVVSCMTSEALNRALLQSDLFIGRSGYSSLMDLARVKKRALLIPTPGQTEQAYLAAELSRKGIFYCQNQEELNLICGMKKARQRGGLREDFFDELKVKNAVAGLLSIS